MKSKAGQIGRIQSSQDRFSIKEKAAGSGFGNLQAL